MIGSTVLNIRAAGGGRNLAATINNAQAVETLKTFNLYLAQLSVCMPAPPWRKAQRKVTRV
ncbi:protein of unknown function [Candidatus Filomicrobium marinum]|nr:protein of unknown function [Candidatus Filomicrobium marinum]